VTRPEFPQDRRAYLQWRYAMSDDELDAFIVAANLTPSACPMPGPLGAFTAVLGEDGRYHLHVGTAIQCSRRRRRDDPQGWQRHAQSCLLDPAGWRNDQVSVSWQFQLTETIAEAVDVPPAHRCPCELVWPIYHRRDTPIGRIRTILVDEFGPDCQGCGNRPGEFVDHEHISGEVRGLLCLTCNNSIDTCPHRAGCPRGDYLNQPPAARLGLIYPHASETRRRHRAKTADGGREWP